MNVQESVEEAIESSKDRNFTQSVDIVINLKNVDLKNPENRFSENLALPSPLPDTKICAIGDLVVKDADNADKKISSDDLDEYKEDEGLLKNLADEYDFFVAEAPLM